MANDDESSLAPPPNTLPSLAPSPDSWRVRGANRGGESSGLSAILWGESSSMEKRWWVCVVKKEETRSAMGGS